MTAAFLSLSSSAPFSSATLAFRNGPALSCFPHSNSKMHFAKHHGASASRRLFVARAEIGLSELAPKAAVIYGSLLLGGGLFAYSRSASKGSLFGGLTGGALLALVYVLMSSQDTKYVGDAVGFGTALVFIAVFGIRLAATRKIVPAAPLLLLSVAACFVFVGAYMQDRGI